MSDSLVASSSPHSADSVIDKQALKDLLVYLLNSFRSRLAVQDVSEGCPFDFQAFLESFRLMKDDQYFNSTFSQQYNFLLQQGLLDSLIPYLKASFKTRSSSSQPQRINNDIFPNLNSPLLSLHYLGTSKQLPVIKSRSSISEKPHEDHDIVIHVCDEGKGIWKDFTCRQSLLTKGMGYFTRVTVKGQKLQDMDISVHCEIGIFDWLLKWVHQQAISHSSKINDHAIDTKNVVGLIVSADFLQMPTLVTTCLEFIYTNISSVIKESPNLGCLSDSLTAKLANMFSNAELENRVVHADLNDRITSRLYIQLILLMNSTEPDHKIGHYASTSTLFKCKICKKFLINEMAHMIPCNSIKLDSYGHNYAHHYKDENWSLASFIRELKRSIKHWRKVYWRLWGIIHYFHCKICNFYYPAKYSSSCKFHPNDPLQQTHTGNKESPKVNSHLRKYFPRKYQELEDRQRSEAEQTATTESADDTRIFAKYTCCNSPMYKFNPLPKEEGCQVKDHVPNPTNNLFIKEKAELFYRFRELIVEESEAENDPAWSNIINFQGLRNNSGLTVHNLLDNLNSKKKVEKQESVDGSQFEAEAETELPENCLLNQYGYGAVKETSFPGQNQLWSWNPDLTTRYNQDMQREMEEKCMLNLCKMLAQRIPLDSKINGILK